MNNPKDPLGPWLCSHFVQSIDKTYMAERDLSNVEVKSGEAPSKNRRKKTHVRTKRGVLLG